MRGRLVLGVPARGGGSTAKDTMLRCSICCSNPELGRQLREQFTAPGVDVSRVLQEWSGYLQSWGSREVRL